MRSREELEKLQLETKPSEAKGLPLSTWGRGANGRSPMKHRWAARNFRDYRHSALVPAVGTEDTGRVRTSMVSRES